MAQQEKQDVKKSRGQPGGDETKEAPRAGKQEGPQTAAREGKQLLHSVAENRPMIKREIGPHEERCRGPFLIQSFKKIVGTERRADAAIGRAVIFQAKLGESLWVFDSQGRQLFATENIIITRHEVGPAAISGLAPHCHKECRHVNKDHHAEAAAAESPAPYGKALGKLALDEERIARLKQQLAAAEAEGRT